MIEWWYNNLSTYSQLFLMREQRNDTRGKFNVWDWRPWPRDLALLRCFNSSDRSRTSTMKTSYAWETRAQPKPVCESSTRNLTLVKSIHIPTYITAKSRCANNNSFWFSTHSVNTRDLELISVIIAFLFNNLRRSKA